MTNSTSELIFEDDPVLQNPFNDETEISAKEFTATCKKLEESIYIKHPSILEDEHISELYISRDLPLNYGLNLRKDITETAMDFYKKDYKISPTPIIFLTLSKPYISEDPPPRFQNILSYDALKVPSQKQINILLRVPLAGENNYTKSYLHSLLHDDEPSAKEFFYNYSQYYQFYISKLAQLLQTQS